MGQSLERREPQSIKVVVGCNGCGETGWIELADTRDQIAAGRDPGAICSRCGVLMRPSLPRREAASHTVDISRIRRN